MTLKYGNSADADLQYNMELATKQAFFLAKLVPLRSITDTVLLVLFILFFRKEYILFLND